MFIKGSRGWRVSALMHLMAREVAGKYFCIFSFFFKNLVRFLLCVEAKMTEHFDEMMNELMQEKNGERIFARITSFQKPFFRFLIIPELCFSFC